MMDLLKQLCALPGVSSFEDAVRDYIKEQVAPYVDTMNVDAMGNLICFKKGAKATETKLMLCAHMDEVGLMVRSITEDGYLKFVCVGGWTAGCCWASRCWWETARSPASLA